MAKKEISKDGPKDLGTVKEVYCSGVAVTTTGQKIFLANVAKGDRIIEEDGKKKVAPKAEKPGAKNQAPKNDIKQSEVNPPVIGGEEDGAGGSGTPPANSNDNL